MANLKKRKVGYRLVKRYQDGGTVNPKESPVSFANPLIGNFKTGAQEEQEKSDTELYEKYLDRQRFAESSNNPKALNKDSGARGIAQITPITLKESKRLGFVPETTTMEDLDNPEVSKKIQRDYMDLLLKKKWNKGTPTVKMAKALIAYNHGPTATFKELRDLKNRGVDIYDESLDWLKHFNKESREYVQKILANDPNFEKEYAKANKK